MGVSSGVYLGTWTSSLARTSAGYELDIYGGYAGKAGDFGYDVGVMSYQHPVNETYFNGLNFNASDNIVNFGAAYIFGSDDDTTAMFSRTMSTTTLVWRAR